MRISYRLKYALGKWVNTPFGFMPMNCYEFERGSAIPDLLSLVIGDGDRDVALTRLKCRRRFENLSVDSDDGHCGSGLAADLLNSLAISDYGYEISGVPVTDLVVPQLVHWAIHLYGDRTILAPGQDAIFVIRGAV